MATSPRPGIIQLDHPNVYMAAKEAQKDDWLRQGLDIFGNAIQERNRDIRYRRASGKDDDRYTTEDLVKQGLPKAWEGAKALGSGIASVAEGAWGLLKAPFTDEEQAPTVTEDYRTEVGEKTTSPLAETPTDIIDRPEQILNAPKTVSEVDGLPSTQTAEPGVKVSFPMTVAGTVERSNLPDTVIPKPAAQAPDQEQAQASVPQGMLQSPDWSEMFRLDPERAKYDWTRKQQQEELAIKATPKLSPDSSLDDIRATHNTYLNYLATLEQKGVNTDDPRYIAAKKNLDYAAGLLADRGLLPKPAEGGSDETPEQKAARLAIGNRALSDGRQAIAKAVDAVSVNGKKGPDGIIDNEGDIDKALNDILLSTGVNKNSNEWKIVESEWASTKQRVRDAVSTARQLKEYAQADADRARGITIAGQNAYNSNPDVIAYKTARDALAFYGASNKDIAAKRKMVYDFIKSYNTGTVLDSELASTLGATGDAFANIVNRVKQAAGLPPDISDAQADAIVKTLENQMTVLKRNADKAYTDIKKAYGATPSKVDDAGNAKPRKGKNETMAAYLKRLDAWKAKGGK